MLILHAIADTQHFVASKSRLSEMIWGGQSNVFKHCTYILYVA